MSTQEEVDPFEIYISLEGFIPSGVTRMFQNLLGVVADIFVVVSERLDTGSAITYFELHRTETIRINDTLMKTNFTRELLLHRPINGTKRHLRFQIFRRESERLCVEGHTLLATSYIKLPRDDIFSDNTKKMSFDLVSETAIPSNCKLVLDCERVEHRGEDIAKLSFKGCNLPESTTWALTPSLKPFLVIYRRSARKGNELNPEKEENEEKVNDSTTESNEEWTRIWTTEASAADAKWMEICMPLRKLCNGDYLRQLKIECWYWKENREHQIVGEIRTNFETLLTLPRQLLFSSEKKAGLKVKSAYVCRDSEFQRHLKTCELQLVVAIDHCIREIPGHDVIDECKQAVKATCEILEKYDKDKLIQCFGFTEESYEGNNQIEGNIFPLDARNEQIKGAANVLKAYEESLSKLEGRTVDVESPRLASCIRHIVENVIKTDNRAMKRKKKYFTLLIVTDGNINAIDFRDAIDVIVDASKLPLSIILVGVGSGDFSKMITLDGDNCILASGKGELGKRDIVQFVRYHNLKGDANALMSETMWELPSQFLSYMNAQG